MSMRLSWWPFGRDLLLAIGLVATLSAVTALAAQPSVVVVSNPVEREVTDYADFTGRLTAVQTVDIRPRVSGFLQKVHVQGGALVKEGEVLFEIDSRPYLAAWERAKAELAQHEARRRFLDAEYQRALKLQAAKAISQEDVTKIAADRAQAEAAHQLRKLDADRARLDFDATKVRSPLNGRIGLPRVTAGDQVSSGANATTLATVVSLDPIGVTFDVDERTLLRMLRDSREGKKVGPTPLAIGLADEKGFPHKGLLESVDNQVDPKTGTIQVRGVLPKPKGLLMPGLFARVRLPVGAPRKVLLVNRRIVDTPDWLKKDRPRSATGAVVWVVNAKNVVENREVTVGQLHGDMRVVEAGLRADDLVFVDGPKGTIRAGDTVTVRRDPMPEAKKPVEK
ncbi:MAG TPA: efflux RND transporter periplasmic adaptor subunit [Gemmataceae bacterium]|nr:efflux RND transporter periplasmic adaptor subunit [Gemmataceae bacterium]